MIVGAGSWSPCGFCGTGRAKTVDLSFVAEHISERLHAFYGCAVDQLPYDSAEGGYQARNFDTYDLLTDEVGLELPRDGDGALLAALVDAIGDDQWCAYDWTQLEIDESLQASWDYFCREVKHRRRFFFHGDRTGRHAPDDRSPIELFDDLSELLEDLGRLRTFPAGLPLFRARPRSPGERHTTPASLGPPPQEMALQANRMNPAGIPMFYAADHKALAIAEVQDARVSLGRFETTRSVRVIDLVDLPRVPGFFSRAPRSRRQLISFLHAFAVEISRPVPRDERVHVDYLPTQVLTEFLRDAPFEGGPIDGIRYPSATAARGSNFVLFAGQADVHGAVAPSAWDRSEPWLRLVEVRHRRGARPTVENRD